MKITALLLIATLCPGLLLGDGLTVEGDLDVQGNASIAGSMDLPYIGGFYSTEIDIAGDANTYYPVVFTSLGGDGRIHDLFVFRKFNDPAPSSWYTASHRGALSIHLRVIAGSWGGIPLSLDTLRHEYYYSTQFAKAELTDHGKMLTLWLRGGGARYKIAGTLPSIETPIIAYSLTLMHDYANNAHDDYVEPTTIVTAKTVEPLTIRITDGKVGLSTSLPEEKLDVNGNAIIRGNLTVDGFIRVPPQGDIPMFGGN